MSLPIGGGGGGLKWTNLSRSPVMAINVIDMGKVASVQWVLVCVWGGGGGGGHHLTFLHLCWWVVIDLRKISESQMSLGHWEYVLWGPMWRGRGRARCGRGGGGSYTVKSNASWVVVMWVYLFPLWTDTHEWKYYLSATLLFGDNKLRKISESQPIPQRSLWLCFTFSRGSEGRCGSICYRTSRRRSTSSSTKGSVQCHIHLNFCIR